MQTGRAQLLMVLGLTALTGACATLSPTSRIESELRSLGVSEPRAECLAEDLGDHLDRNDLKAVADFLTDLNQAGSAGGALDALLSIENPRAAAAIASAGITCAFGG